MKGPGGLLDAARSIILIRTRDTARHAVAAAVAYDSALGPQISKLFPCPARVSIIVRFTIAVESPQEKKKEVHPLILAHGTHAIPLPQ